MLQFGAAVSSFLSKKANLIKAFYGKHCSEFRYSKVDKTTELTESDFFPVYIQYQQ